MGRFHVLFCVDKVYGYAKDGRMPWRSTADLTLFKEKTCAPERPMLLMGRKTYESMPESVFEGKRHACVLTRKARKPVGNVTFCTSVERAVFHCKDHTTFLIGGAGLIRECILSNLVDKIDLTVLKGDFNCDQHLGDHFKSINSPIDELHSSFIVKPTREIEDGMVHHFEQKTRGGNEQQYLDLMKKCLSTSILKADRTGQGRHSLFGEHLTFDLRTGFPLLTSKKMFWKGIVEELLWFLRGDTDVKKLQSVGVHIWDGNSTREYMDSIGITNRDEGDIGPCYGWQWRHFGAEYKDAQTDYEGMGVDQIHYIYNCLSRDTSSSRAIMSAWNASDLAQMNLPPCHVLYQFSVHGGALCCHMYQRSADIFLGLPFNMASSALLCHIMARMLKLPVGTLSISIGDAHIYNNHIEQCFEQLERKVHPSCTLEITRASLSFEDLPHLKLSDFKLNNYKHEAAIKAEMAI